MICSIFLFIFSKYDNFCFYQLSASHDQLFPNALWLHVKSLNLL